LARIGEGDKLVCVNSGKEMRGVIADIGAPFFNENGQITSSLAFGTTTTQGQ